jgi:multidrug efflux pump
MNIDLVNRNISFGAPSTQWWTQLASAIAGGLTFATLLTLMLTPCLLILGEEIWGKLSVAKEYAYKILLSFKKYYKK